MLDNQFEELCFILSHYTKLSIEEKWSLLQESLIEEKVLLEDFKPLKKLSEYKKASFFEFKIKFDSHRKKEELIHKGAGWISVLNDRYPSKLKEIYLPPLVLFYKGNYEWIDQNIIGVVGARECTDYGRAVIESVLPPLVEKGIIITSGLAKGIDSLAHENTINKNGHTIAVIGTGLDRYYPSSNQHLQKEIESHHLLLSEFPLGTKPFRHHFPLRNRIISGISMGIIVIEAKKRSGSLITAYQALEQNREVYAIPGTIFNLLSEGTNELIKSGAIMVTSPADILKDLNLKMY